MTGPLLEVEALSVAFGPKLNPVRAVDAVSFTVNAGEAVGIVGESGSGKSVTSLAILRLVPDPPGRIVGGRIRFAGADLLSLPPARMPEIRGRDIGMIFQEPMSSLNPVMTIGDQITEAVMLHERISARRRRALALEMLDLVGIPNPAERFLSYPHQFSGGMRQRVMIAMALVCRPKLVIADEPTTALDVTIQAQVLALMNRIRSTFGTAILIISHDFGVIAEVADRVVVMYAGRIVEQGDVRSIFRHPAHPYTRGLLQSIPRLEDDRRRLYQIPGSVPAPGARSAGCPFCPRCPDRLPICANAMPPMAEVGPSHHTACWTNPGASVAGAQ
jgi:peptide/nickel transport system ATP-binding protein